MMRIRFTAANVSPAQLHCCFYDGGTPLHDPAGMPGITAPAAKQPFTITAYNQHLAFTQELQAIAYTHHGDIARVSGAATIKQARKLGLHQLCWHCSEMGVGQFAEMISGALLAEYEFTRYKGTPSRPQTSLEVLVVAGKQATLFKKVLAAKEREAAAVNYARDLANTSGSDLVPEGLANAAQELAKTYGFTFSKLTAAHLKQQGYVGCIAVGQASEHPPVLFTLEYKPKKPTANAQPICFVGKGITFDTGGISIKPWDGMWDMKGDMGGAAAVLGIFRAIGELKPNMPVTGVVAAAENMPGGKAYLPGDVLRYKNGRTVEIKSTDAEGRLVLADALIHAQRKLHQKRIVEFSTLTGACVRALGPQYIGLMSNFPQLSNQVKTASDACGELVWELPLHPEYRAMISSPVADIKNSGGALAGAQTAGWFLHEFIDEGTQYVHLDIAGPFLTEKDDKYWSQPGATGSGVRLGIALVS